MLLVGHGVTPCLTLTLLSPILNPTSPAGGGFHRPSPPPVTCRDLVELSNYPSVPHVL